MPSSSTPPAITLDTSDASLRKPLIAGFAMVLIALACTCAVRLSGVSISEPDAPAVVTRTLRFEDQSDGSIAVVDAHSQQRVETVRGQAGFIRGTLRGLARARRSQGIGPQPPFELIARADGRLTLFDPSTGRRVDLDSFGPTNKGDFVRMLAPPSPDTL